MRNRFVLGAVAAATMLGVLPDGTAIAQPRAPGQSPVQAAGAAAAAAGAAPLTGVCVSAVPVAAAQSTVYAVSSSGTYTLSDLLPGRYLVEFQAGCGQSGVKAQWWDDAASSATAKIITVGSGATIGSVSAVMAGG